MQSPSILKESKNPDSPFHIGGIGSFMQPLCENFTEDETDLTGWISSRDWMPNERFCAECAELYRNDSAWKFPSGRE